MSILDFFPYNTPRQIQVETLEILEREWDNYDVFVIQAPTAYGKTSISKTLHNALHSVSTITPTNLLVQQYLDEFPDTNTLARLDSYHCKKWDRPCSITRGKLRQFCSKKRDGCECPASNDLRTAKYARGPGIYNYYTYMAHRIYREALVIDEAHNTLTAIRDRLAITIWQHDYKYPHNMWTYDQIREWINTLPEHKKKHKKIAELKEAVQFQVPKYIAQRTTDVFNGKGTRRGEPEERDCIKLLPVDISEAPPMLWSREVRKIILMSATIGPKDIEQLGLERNRRVLYLACKSPIPPQNRPIVPLDTLSVNRYSMENQAPRIIANKINEIAEFHKGEKGVIHCTYALSAKLRSLLTDSRYIFHGREDKAEKYQQFRDSPTGEGRILVACGLYEGIDLPDDLGRWQVIAKVPWMSLANPAIKHLAELDPDWYNWECLKTTIQACGRVCRHPDDFGATYILDSSFRRLIRKAYEMCPEWFLEAIDQQWLGELLNE